MAYNVLMRR